ncbi:MAG: hypothetical protein GX053_00120 [Tissierella sp.]|nr:hypothetical protein [Tissierella sp.]
MTGIIGYKNKYLSTIWFDKKVGVCKRENGFYCRLFVLVVDEDGHKGRLMETKYIFD